MDAQAKKKALFRAKLNAQKKDKRIESPLVRYNESDQPVCRVCNVVLKSESNWDAHQASRKHHEAINNLKANAAGLRRGNDVKSESLLATKTAELQQDKLETLTKLSKPQTSSGLPPNFFDNQVTTKQKTDSVKSVHETGATAKTVQPSKQIAKGVLPEGFFDKKEADLISPSVKPTSEIKQTSVQTNGSETKQLVKRALPEGFFDNKEADLLARGIKLVKPDIKDEYKEFEKLIQEDLQVVDNRMEEEEIDAAETIEEEEQVEQKSYNEKVEMLKRKKMELEAARSAKRSKASGISAKGPKDEESSSDDGDDEDDDFAIDWRAQHL